MAATLLESSRMWLFVSSRLFLTTTISSYRFLCGFSNIPRRFCTIPAGGPVISSFVPEHKSKIYRQTLLGASKRWEKKCRDESGEEIMWEYNEGQWREKHKKRIGERRGEERGGEGRGKERKRGEGKEGERRGREGRRGEEKMGGEEERRGQKRRGEERGGEGRGGEEKGGEGRRGEGRRREEKKKEWREEEKRQENRNGDRTRLEMRKKMTKQN